MQAKGKKTAAKSRAWRGSTGRPSRRYLAHSFAQPASAAARESASTVYTTVATPSGSQPTWHQMLRNSPFIARHSSCCTMPSFHASRLLIPRGMPR